MTQTNDEDIIKAVRRQLEFYFSDANLRRERFMKTIMNSSSDGQSVSIEVLFTFNKLSALTDLKEIVCTAVNKSKQLELSNDGNSVRRRKPFLFTTTTNKQETNESENPQHTIDERSIYIARLPADCCCESLKERLCSYGKIAYVSLPVYKTTKSIRGFGFVEFKKAKSVTKALNDLKSPDENERRKCAWEYFSRYTKKISALVKSAKQMSIENPFVVNYDYCLVSAEDGFTHLTALSKIEWLIYKEEFRKWQIEQSNILSKAIEACTDEYLQKTVATTSVNNNNNNNNQQIQTIIQEVELKEEIKSKEIPPKTVEDDGKILKINSSTALQSLYKANIRQALSDFAQDIAYLDVIDLRLEGFIRFKTKEAAQLVLERKQKESNEFLIDYEIVELTTTEVMDYHDKMENDRLRKKEANKRKACKRQAQLAFKEISHKRQCALGPDTHANPRRSESL